jgi:hypothetical protein
MILISLWLAPLVFYFVARQMADKGGSAIVWRAYAVALACLVLLTIFLTWSEHSTLTPNALGLILWAIIWHAPPLAIASYAAGRFVRPSPGDYWKIGSLLALAELVSVLSLLAGLIFGWFGVGHGHK